MNLDVLQCFVEGEWGRTATMQFSVARQRDDIEYMLLSFTEVIKVFAFLSRPHMTILPSLFF